jgi:hypothetical protein
MPDDLEVKDLGVPLTRWRTPAAAASIEATPMTRELAELHLDGG